MLKKRIIFTLLYANGDFVLSRNFRLQRVGDIEWLERNYNFRKIAFHIDELVVLNVSRDKGDWGDFCAALKKLSAGCFVPIAAGGGIRSKEEAIALLDSGADKIVVNTMLMESEKTIRDLVTAFGRQCLVGSLDLKRSSGEGYCAYVENGTRMIESSVTDEIRRLSDGLVGELYLNSIDRDGTGQGFDFEILDLVPSGCSVPIILAGGAGNSQHLQAGLRRSSVDAVATANLLNFVGDGLAKARANIIDSGVPLASWPSIEDVASTLNIEIYH